MHTPVHRLIPSVTIVLALLIALLPPAVAFATPPQITVSGNAERQFPETTESATSVATTAAPQETVPAKGLAAETPPAEAALASWTFSGKVLGNPRTSYMNDPVANVHIRLYGSDSAGAQGTLLDSTGTNAAGDFSLVATQYYDYFNVIKYDPAGYHAYDADGSYLTKVNSNWLQGHYLEGDETYTENYFWIVPDTNTATPTPTATSSPTPTPTSTPGVGRQTHTFGLITITADEYQDLGGGRTGYSGNIWVGRPFHPDGRRRRCRVR